MEEIWKDIKGFEGKYQISNMGRVKSLNFNKTCKEKLMKSRISNGYRKIKLYDKNNKPIEYGITKLLIENFDLSEIYDAEKIDEYTYKFDYAIQYKGKVYKNYAQLAAAYNLTSQQLRERLHRYKWTFEEALEIPLLNHDTKLKVRLFNYNGKLYSVEQISKLKGLKKDAIYRRLRRGWSIEQVMEIPLSKSNNMEGYNGKGEKRK